MTYPSDVDPSEWLLSHLFKGIMNRTLTVRSVWSVRSRAFQLKSERKRQGLTNDVDIVLTEQPEEMRQTRSFATYVTVPFTWLLTYARAGCERLQGRECADEQRITDTTLMVSVPWDILMIPCSPDGTSTSIKPAIAVATVP